MSTKVNKTDEGYDSQRKGDFRIERFPNPEVTAEAAGAYVNDVLTQYVDTPILLLLAGGSALAMLEHIQPTYLSADLTVTVTDDRFSDELDINNFSVLQSTSFYNTLISADAFCINTQPNAGETIEECSARFEKNLREWVSDFPTGKVIAVYGMGPDGHTAGMIPNVLSEVDFENAFNTRDRWVATLDATGKNEFPLRFSTTLPFMRDIVDHAIFYITGAEKKKVFDKAIAKEGIVGKVQYSEIPAKVMTEMKDTVVFTDIAE